MALLLIISLLLLILSVVGWVVILKISIQLRVHTLVKISDDERSYIGFLIINQLTSYKQGKSVVFSLITISGERLIPSGYVKKIKVIL